jgi:hypothetical protein
MCCTCSFDNYAININYNIALHPYYHIILHYNLYIDYKYKLIIVSNKNQHQDLEQHLKVAIMNVNGFFDSSLSYLCSVYLSQFLLF